MIVKSDIMLTSYVGLKKRIAVRWNLNSVTKGDVGDGLLRIEIRYSRLGQVVVLRSGILETDVHIHHYFIECFVVVHPCSRIILA